MSLDGDLKDDVATIFRQVWDDTESESVPDPSDVPFGNRGVSLDATVLYADIASSTNLVESHSKHVAGEVYKSFLHCAGRIIRNEGGVITSYDGDRIMAVFVGERKNSAAAKAALHLNYARSQIINPALHSQYDHVSLELKHVVGIATGNLLAARIGVRGDNDLVWIGDAANYAAKLTALPPTYPTYITAEVYNDLDKSSRLHGSYDMWEPQIWAEMGDMLIYRSLYYWAL